MQKSLIILLFLGIALSCAPKVKTNITQKHQPLNYADEVVVLEKTDSIPTPSERLGTIKVGDAGMTIQCNYAQVLEKAKEQARIAGGNSIRIIEHKSPNFMSTCHRITVEVLRLDANQIKNIQASENAIDPTMDYSIINVYRPRGTGGLVSYNLYLGDSLICRVNSRFKQQIKITKTGATELWAKTESKAAIPIELVKGKQYYLRCSVAMGVMVGRPSLELVSEKVGQKDLATLQSKSK